MGRASLSEWYRGDRRGRQTKYEGRKSIIARAARTCFGREGIAKTSIADITREVDITRELFYYYFPNKDAVIAAVVEGYVNDARELLEEQLDAAENEPSSLLLQVMRALRSWLALDDDKPVPMLAMLHEADIETLVLYRVAEEAMLALRGSAALGQNNVVGDPATPGRIASLVGSMCVMRCDKNARDEDLVFGIAPLFAGTPDA